MPASSLLNPAMLTPCQVFKSLADETRLRCLVLLHRQGKLCVCELTHALDVLQPKISRHLAQLRQTGLLLDSREGQWVYYHINPDLPVWVKDLLDLVVGQSKNDVRQQADLARLLAFENRPGLSRCL